MAEGPAKRSLSSKSKKPLMTIIKGKLPDKPEKLKTTNKTKTFTGKPNLLYKPVITSNKQQKVEVNGKATYPKPKTCPTETENSTDKKEEIIVTTETNIKVTPAKLEDFKILRTIGAGSFGRVVLVQHQISLKFYAMKVLNKARVIQHTQAEIAVREKEILMSINHQFLINLYSFFKDNCNLYLVTEFVPGGELFDYLQKSKQVSEVNAKFYAVQVCLALEYLHGQGIVYRDLKPENILIGSDGYLKLVDFGFAKKIWRHHTWTFCGTNEYLAPEIVLNKGHTKAVDWWSFGVFLFEINAGYPPFYSSSKKITFERITTCRYYMPSHFTSRLKHLNRSLLQADLSKRFGNLVNGVNDIKYHLWFEGINWRAIANKEVVPPFVPECPAGDGDTSNFEEYDEEDLEESETEQYADLFKDF
ncbi:cAMP-dependent protein kinase catalytic subunit beta-like [Dysidea avara]|uniref:cAMP-dependent protein kinase catalytic subunit beta-like n=1 Tax=Dysidea avara TaxID=196820 RepID=UPI003316EA35